VFLVHNYTVVNNFGEATRLRVLSHLEVCRLWYEYAGDVYASLDADLAPLRAQRGAFQGDLNEIGLRAVRRELSREEAAEERRKRWNKMRQAEEEARPKLRDLEKARVSRQVALLRAKPYFTRARPDVTPNVLSVSSVTREAAHAAGVEAARQAQATIVSIEPYLNPGPRAA
jgi:hypothetical protein